jgi:lanosterol synthase
MVQTRNDASLEANGASYANGHQPNGHTKQAWLSTDEKTDYTRWRLLDERGRQTWHYLETDEEVEKWPQTAADKFHLGLPTVQCLRNYMFTY